jgi:hypothetical protein
VNETTANETEMQQASVFAEDSSSTCSPQKAGGSKFKEC